MAIGDRIKEFFKPEFRNRLDLVCKFNTLEMLSIKKIVVKFVDELKKQLLEKHNITLNLKESVIEHLADKGYDSKMGARPLARKIDELLRVPISKKILFERLKDVNIMADVVDDEIQFVSHQKMVAAIGYDGIVVVE